MGDLSIEMVKSAVPSNLRGSISQEFVDTLNTISSDPEAAEIIKENFISYTGVLNTGKYKTEAYLNAVTYVSFKLMGYSNLDAYMRAFPQRYQRLLANGSTSKDISAYVSAYNRGKLVNAIIEQAMVPTWVLNQDLFQKALNTQAQIMVTAKSEMARVQAANSILTHLKKPEAAGPLVNIDMREDTGMDDLKNLLSELASKQKKMIEEGITAREIAEQRILPKGEKDEY